MFKLGVKYDVVYLQTTKVFNKPKPIEVEIKLNKLMFYKSTGCFYVFWTGSAFVKILKSKLVRYEEYKG